MFFKKLLTVFISYIFLTNLSHGNTVETNPSEIIGLSFIESISKNKLERYDLAINYTNLDFPSVSTHIIPLQQLSTNLEDNEIISIKIPENIRPGEYSIDTYLVTKIQNKKKYLNIKSNISRIIINKNSHSTQPLLMKNNLDYSRIFLSEDNLNIELEFLAPENGFPKKIEIVATVRDLKDQVVLTSISVIESNKQFGTMIIPVDFGKLTNLKSDSYHVSVKLQSTEGLTGLLNTLSNSSEIREHTYDLGEVHILNENNNKNGKTLNISKFGAYPNDGLDDTKAIFEALAALKQIGGGTLLFEAGTYIHNDVIRIQNMANFDIKGQNTILVASNSERSAVIFKECINFSFSGFQLLSPKSDYRRQEFESTGLSVLRSERFTISNNLIYQSAAAGLMIARGSKYYKVHDNTILNTRADAIHSTGASAYGAIYNNITGANGDDGIAVVSYINKRGDTHHIKIYNNNILGNYHGRGIAVVGGSNISIINNHIKETSVAGILVASEYHYNTYGASDISISSNSVINACQKKDNTHPAILIYGRENIKKTKSKDINKSNADTFLRTEDIVVGNNFIQSQKCNGLLRIGPNSSNIILTENIINNQTEKQPIILNKTNLLKFTLYNNVFIQLSN